MLSETILNIACNEYQTGIERTIEMRLSIDMHDLAEMLPMFFAILIGVCIVTWGAFFLVKRSDNNKPLQIARVKVIEKPLSQGAVAWYVFETEDGSRYKLRSFQNNSLHISVGDEGTLKFKGKTVQSFERTKQ